MEQDTLSWLHNKLSNSENTWSSTGIASQFNENLLKYIYDSFLQLEAKEKIQLLLSFLEIPLRNMESFKARRFANLWGFFFLIFKIKIEENN